MDRQLAPFVQHLELLLVIWEVQNERPKHFFNMPGPSSVPVVLSRSLMLLAVF